MHIIVVCITFYRITAYHMNAIASFYKCLPSAMYRSNRRLCLRALLQRGLLKQVKALVFICCCHVFMCSREYNYEEGCQILYSCMLLTVVCILAYQYLFLYVCLLICLSVCLSVQLAHCVYMRRATSLPPLMETAAPPLLTTLEPCSKTAGQDNLVFCSGHQT